MSIQAMNISLKNNRNQISKREKFQSRLSGYNSDKKTEYNLPEATSKQLRDIRKKTQQERKVLWAKGITLTIIIFSVLAYFLFKL